MAKQLGVHKLHGKVDEQSYYYSKNGGYQSRKINPGMGARVKNDAAYANTRLNNAEFGACGACAGAMIRPVTQRWRFILDSIATGKMVKAMKAAMQEDTTSAWGKRLIPVTQMPNIQDVFNAFSKNTAPEELVNYLSSKVLYDSTSKKISTTESLQLSDTTIDQLKAKGADGVVSRVYAFTVSAPAISSDGNSYARPLSILASCDNFNSVTQFSDLAPEPIISSDVEANAPAVINEITQIGGILVILLPYKLVGATQYTLQELCSAVWVPATAGTVE